jgi:hypothetical protein
MTCLFTLLCFPFDCGGASSCPTVRLEPSMRPNNERTRFGLQPDTSFLFSMVTLSLWCWFSAGCAGGDRFSSRSLRPAAGKMVHARDRRLCPWLHPHDGRSQPSSSRFHDRPSFAPSPGRRRRHALSEREVRRMSRGVKGATLAAAARSRKITATPSSASPRSRTRPPRTARPNNAPASCPRIPAMRRRLPLYQKACDRSIRIALSARTLMVNVSSSAFHPRSKLCWTGIEPSTIGRVPIA